MAKTVKNTGGGTASTSGRGRQLVIVESPAKAKTINKYLGPDFQVEASVGHVRDLPKRNPKGVDSPVPGIDLDNDFQPNYVPIDGKKKTIRELKKVARTCDDIWLATDLDREGEAIAWHLAEELELPVDRLKRVVFNAVTKQAIERAFQNPRAIDMDMVNAQQARRILDRIVGYQVSPLLWKKVAGGLSAGRVQSVTVMLVVEREQLIRAHVPDESWSIGVCLARDPAEAAGLVDSWAEFIAQRDEKGKPPTRKQRNAWLDQHRGLRTQLVEVGGAPFLLECSGEDPPDLTDDVRAAAEAAGLVDVEIVSVEDEDGKGPARYRREVTGRIDPATVYRVKEISTRPSPASPRPPFKTSTLQRAAATYLGFTADRTMRAAQSLYQGVALGGGDQVGLITYMRTDSTHLADEAIQAARTLIESNYGEAFRPDTPRIYETNRDDAQEAHEAIRPTDVKRTPDDLRSRLNDDQWKLYDLIWRRFLACQMTDAQWESTTVLMERADRETGAVLKAKGRVQVFAGFQEVAGVAESDEQVLPALTEDERLAPFDILPRQKFSSPPARYNEASLIKKLEEEGIGRPSTYASILKVIQDRRYAEKRGGAALFPTDLGEVVTEKLKQGFPRIMDVGYTKWMEGQLDAVEGGDTDWVEFLREFYGPFRESLESAHEAMTHAKAETELAPDEYRCPDCGKRTEYRFGKNGKFLSCTGFNVKPIPSEIDCPECQAVPLDVNRGKTARARPFLTCSDCQHKLTWRKLTAEQKETVAEMAAKIPEPCRYAAPIDFRGRPIEPERTNVACPKCGEAMIRRTGRFGPFLSCPDYPACDGVANLDRKTGVVKLPKPPPLETDLLCSKCDQPLNLRNGKRGPWLGCSTFPKCKGRQGWVKLEEEIRDRWAKALTDWEAENQPSPLLTTDGERLEEGFQPVVQDDDDDDDDQEDGGVDEQAQT
ncbi:MAG: DNA topoisomerase I [Planctomycetaceae bacterium]|nr:DNA topoisomerase I [Planctomycetaceae bacterium]